MRQEPLGFDAAPGHPLPDSRLPYSRAVASSKSAFSFTASACVKRGVAW
jgi:hypothetical protein